MPHNSKLPDIKVGDVWRARSGRLRVVRYVRMGDRPRNTWLCFSILHCSWTHRPYTHYNLGELLQMGYQPTGTRVSLRKKIDKAIAKEIADGPRCLDCCDVRGIS